mmetsp:Transcript_1353/g.2680  ORF Transcript_1353/g.2680 Transcript_1353/m.2680 type:complete len:379 (-) Transcript_1353:412-1548(-)
MRSYNNGPRCRGQLAESEERHRAPARGRDPTVCTRSGARIAGAQIAAGEVRVIGGVGRIFARGDVDDFHEIEFVLGVLLAAHHDDVLETLVIVGTVEGRAVAQTIEFVAFQRLDHGAGIEAAATRNRVCVEHGLGIAGLSGLRRREAVFLTEGLHEGIGACVAVAALVLNFPVPVLGAENADDVATGTARHQLGVERHDDLEVDTVHLQVAQAELHRLRQRVDHVATVVVQDQKVGAGVGDRGDVGREVARAHRGQNGVGGLPTHVLGVGLHRALLRPTPGVVGGQVIGATVGAVSGLEDRRQRTAGLLGVEEVAEAIGTAVLAGRVVGVGQTGHENHACVLAETLHRDGHTGRRTAGDHDRTVALNHRAGRGACGVG